MRAGRWNLPLVFFVSIVLSCASNPPYTEYNLAHIALRSAKAADSERLAPGLWYEAEKNYNLGESLFKDRYYDRARAAFKRALEAAEKAENAARVIRFKEGVVF